MTKRFANRAVLFSLVAILAAPAFAQQRTPALTTADIEAAYTELITKRTEGIVAHLGLTNSAKSNQVMNIIMSQYRALRARDDVLTAAASGETEEAVALREKIYQAVSKPLHERFIEKLSTELSPDQLEIVKDRMTYNKVKVTFDAYCDIIPDLTDSDKAKIKEWLKEAREEAMDGGSANAKSEIFQRYKDRINAHLNAHGHDVEKAYADWNTKRGVAAKQENSQ